jgi:APA family basic amino acid/polyamine antiporter
MSSIIPSTAQAAETQNNGTTLSRSLSCLDTTMINIGSMIGSGIFFVPAIVAMYLPNSSLYFAVWIIGGIFSLIGALSIAELGAEMPHAGGQYVY